MRRRLFLLLPLAALVGCNSANFKENVGTGVGAILGAGLGYALCHNSDDREKCAVMGAAAGALLGNTVGKRLDERDRQRHAEATQAVLVAQQNHAAQQWQNKEAGTSGKVTVLEQKQTQSTSKIPVYLDKVEKVPPLELIDQRYTTQKTVNVRVGPGTAYRKAPPSLSPGETFDVIGRVIDTPNWLMIEKDGIGSGFVYAPLVSPLGLAGVPNQQVVSNTSNISVVNTSTLKTCKTVKHEITYDDGQTETDTVEMCQNDDGSWTLA